MLKKIFQKSALVLIYGEWKKGKTDFGLYLAEILLKMKLIDEVATNIYTFDKFLYIHDYDTLNAWLKGSKSKKLYIFDEGMEHLTNLRTMSKKNVDVTGLMPQLSKAYARFMLIAQDINKVDGGFRNHTFKTAEFEKKTITHAQIKSKLLEEAYDLWDIEPTKIPFDPYRFSEWQEHAPIKIQHQFKDQDYKFAYHDVVLGESAEKQGINSTTLTRAKRKVLKDLIQRFELFKKQELIEIEPIQS
jgi:hypothetical protein